jgi:divalent metal cation (Fe/Co/Zn/Cd) transporter
VNWRRPWSPSWCLLITRPASDEFTFGFSKAEYFANGFEAA